MQSRTGMICLAMMSLAFGACGSDTTTTSTTTTTTTAGTTTAGTVSTFTPQQLGDALLTASDLGTGWTETQRDVFATREPENPSIDPSLWCSDGQGDALVTLAGQEGADVELSLGSGDLPFLVRQQAWTNADVETYFTSVETAVAACSGATWTDSEGNSYTLETSTPPEIGDESISWTVTIHAAGTTTATSRSLHTAARFGGVMMVLQAAAIQTTGSDASAPDDTTIVRTAGDKMAALVTP